MAKMCPYRKITSVTSIDGGLLKCTICTKKWPKTGGDCPKNVNPETCEIIIPKREPKLRRVKAWASIEVSGNVIASQDKDIVGLKKFRCIIEYKEASNAR